MTIQTHYDQLQHIYKTNQHQQFIDYYHVNLSDIQALGGFDVNQTMMVVYQLGQCHKTLREYTKSHACFQQLINEHPNSHRGHEGLIFIAQHQQDWNKVIELTLDFIAKFPNMWQGYWWAGHAYKNICEYDKAEEQFLQLQEKLPNDHRGYEGMVNVAQHQQNKPLVIERATIFQNKFPNLWHGYWWLGHAKKDLLNYDEADHQFKQLIDKLPNDYRGYQGLVNVAQHQKDQQKVLERATIFQNKFPDLWQGLWWFGHVNKDLRQYNESQVNFRQLIDRFPNDHHGYEGIINIAQHQQNWHEVIKKSLEFQSKFPNMWQGYWWAGHAYKNICEYKKAEEQFLIIQEKFPNDHRGYEGMINIAQHQQNKPLVIERATIFQNKFPNLWHGYWWLGQTYKELYQYDKAEEWFRLFRENLPNDHRGYEGLIFIPQHRQDWQETIKQSLIFQTKFPNLWQGYWWAGHAYKNIREYDKAEEQFLQLQEKLPNDHHGYEGIINIAQHQQNWHEVIKKSLEFQTRFPNMWQGYWWAGHAYKNIFSFDDAEVCFEKLINSYPNIHHGYGELIAFAIKREEYNTMLDLAFLCQKNNPYLWHGYSWAGQAYRLLKDYLQAKNQFETAIKINPNQTKPYELLMELPELPNDMYLKIIEKYKNQFPRQYFKYAKYYDIFYRVKNINKLEVELISKTSMQNCSIDLRLLLVNFYDYIGDRKKLKKSIDCIKDYDEHFLYWKAKYHYRYKNYIKSQKILYRLIYEYPTYIQGYDLLINILKYSNHQRKLLKINDICKSLFFGLYRGICYSNNSSFVEIKNHYLDYIHSFMDCSEVSLHQKNILELKSINSLLRTYSDDYDLQFRKIELLLMLNRPSEAEELFLKFTKNKHLDYKLNGLKCKIHFCKNDYKKLRECCIEIANKYPEYAGHAIFRHMLSLNALHGNQDVKNIYKKFIKSKQAHNQSSYVSDDVIDLHGNILSGEFLVEKEIPRMNKFSMPEDLFIKIIENNINCPVLYICFSGLLNGDLIKNYPLFDIDDIIKRYLSSPREFKVNNFPYLGFAKQSNYANFIILNDVFRTSHLINLEQSLSIIRNQIEYFNPKYIVCMGASAGGFASVLVGNKIKANAVFSFAPRHPFIMNTSNYPKAIQKTYQIVDRNIIDIAQLQKSSRGFISKTYITLCEHNDCDMLSVQNLDRKDKNLSISYCYGDSHIIQPQLGVKSVFKEIARIVQLEMENNFMLPMQKDFLVNLSAFKYNSIT